MYPKILFITINGWNNTTGTTTIPSIIEGYPVDSVANIFIRSDVPNSAVCRKYFQISEIDVAKSIFGKRIQPGREIKANIMDVDKKFASEYEMHKKLKAFHIPFFPYIRDTIWKLGKWQNENLKNFILDFQPDMVIFPAEGIRSFLGLAEYVLTLTGKPYLMFLWDDNFTYKVHGFTLYRYMLRRKIGKLIQGASSVFAITPKMGKECEQYFGVVPKMLTRPVVPTNRMLAREAIGDRTIQLLYTGSLYINRSKTLKLLIRAIENVNGQLKKDRFFLSIYSNSVLKENEKAEFNVPGVSALHPGVSKDEVVRLQTKADMLVFVEALSGKYRNAARLSFSTKLTDYFAAGKCIFAVAPRDIAPMEYLQYRDAARIADTLASAEQQLLNIDQDTNILNEYGEKAYQCGITYHSKEDILRTFVTTIQEVASGEKIR